MRSPNYFIIKPYKGVRYDNVRKFGDVDFTMSSSIEDHTVTNRLAVIQSTPDWYDGPIVRGDIVVVHHNTFRLYYNMSGKEISSWSFYKDDIYLIDIEQMYLYKKEDGEWQSIAPYCFIKPLLNDNKNDVLNTYVEKSQAGIIKYMPSNSLPIEIGDEVAFKPGSEYAFNIDGEKLYRMKISSICLKV